MKKLFTTTFYVTLLMVLMTSLGISQEKFGGATLYTVREKMNENPKETLKAVADIGYKYIEVVGYNEGKFYGMEPEAFKDYVASLGLVPVSGHFGNATLANADEVIADAKAAGIHYFVIPVPPMGHFKYDPETQTMSMDEDVEFVNRFLNEVGLKCKKEGLELLYHNHDFEFKEINGVKPYDYFLEHTKPEVVNFQMDLFWITKAGEDPVAYFEKYPGRFKMWHVKDMDDDGKFAPVGEGNIDFAPILAKRDVAGLKYYIVEQDMTWELDPIDALKISHKGLKQFGFDKFQ